MLFRDCWIRTTIPTVVTERIRAHAGGGRKHRANPLAQPLVRRRKGRGRRRARRPMAAEEPTHSGSVSPMSKLLGDLEIAREYTTGQVRTLDLLMMSSRHSCEGCHALCPELILVVDILPS